ncbi:hypothetical protein ACFVH6_06485 [Spirillospora sp. NPDC127200]
MSSKSQRLAVAVALTAACAAGAMATGPAAQAVEADRPSVRHALADDHDYGYGPWRPWRFVGEFRNAFLCNGQGAALILSGGARDYRCAEDDGSYELFVR